MGYRVEVFDRNLKRVGEIDEWISLDFSVRLAQEGIWQLLIKDGTRQASLIEKGGGIVIWQDGVSKPIMSGPVDTWQKYWTKIQHTGPGSLYIAGKCHNTLAYSRLAFPDPSRAVTAQWQKGLPVRTIFEPKGGDAIYKELYNSIGLGALSNRRMANVNLTPTSIGKTIGDNLRFDPIGEKLEEWCAERNLAYRFIYNPTAQRVDVEIFQPRDLSKTVRFSPELGNLREYIWTLKAPKVTRAIVGASGEGRARYYYQQIDTAGEAEWGISVEKFIDRRDIPLKVDITDGSVIKSDASMTAADVADAKRAVEDAATAEFADSGGNGNFQIYPIDTPECAFGKHYFVGDKVTVAVDGVEYSDVVREVVVSVDDGGNAQDIKPKIGEQGTGEPLNLYKTVSEMQRKLKRLEARM